MNPEHVNQDVFNRDGSYISTNAPINIEEKYINYGGGFKYLEAYEYSKGDFRSIQGTQCRGVLGFADQFDSSELDYSIRIINAADEEVLMSTYDGITTVLKPIDRTKESKDPDPINTERIGVYIRTDIICSLNTFKEIVKWHKDSSSYYYSYAYKDVFEDVKVILDREKKSVAEMNKNGFKDYVSYLLSDTVYSKISNSSAFGGCYSGDRIALDEIHQANSKVRYRRIYFIPHTELVGGCNYYDVKSNILFTVDIDRKDAIHPFAQEKNPMVKTIANEIIKNGQVTEFKLYSENPHFRLWQRVGNHLREIKPCSRGRRDDKNGRMIAFRMHKIRKGEPISGDENLTTKDLEKLLYHNVLEYTVTVYNEETKSDEILTGEIMLDQEPEKLKELEEFGLFTTKEAAEEWMSVEFRKHKLEESKQELETLKIKYEKEILEIKKSMLASEQKHSEEMEKIKNEIAEKNLEITRLKAITEGIKTEDTKDERVHKKELREIDFKEKTVENTWKSMDTQAKAQEVVAKANARISDNNSSDIASYAAIATAVASIAGVGYSIYKTSGATSALMAVATAGLANPITLVAAAAVGAVVTIGSKVFDWLFD